jgi:hypothetical protein
MLCALVWAACEPTPPSFDPFPVAIDTRSGALLLHASVDQETELLPAVLDTLSPLTLVDQLPRPPGSSRGPRRNVAITLHGSRPDAAPVPRARFFGTPVLELSPCGAGDGAACPIGAAGERGFRALIGADLLSRQALSIDFEASELHFLPDVAGDGERLARQCRAVFPAPYAGGGTLLAGGVESPFLGRRPVLGACIDAPADLPEQLPTEGGVAALLLLSTAVGPTILTASTFDRIQEATGTGRRSADLPTGTVYLPSGPVQAGLGTIDSLSLVGQGARNRGPCQERYTSLVMSRDLCATEEFPDCPCGRDALFCATAAIVELAGPIAVAVIPDELPLVEGLRDELRPGHPEVDGIVGTQVLSALRLDFDYPNGRLIATCQRSEICTARPTLSSRQALSELSACVPVGPS